MIRPRLSKVASGTRLTTDLVNDIINRTEYAADLLRQYKLIAGTEMYVEPHYDGTRVSYLQQVAGGATPTRPPYNDGSTPGRAATYEDLLRIYGQPDGAIKFPSSFTSGDTIYLNFPVFITKDIVLASDNEFGAIPTTFPPGTPSGPPGIWTGHQGEPYNQIIVIYASGYVLYTQIKF